MEFLEGSSKHTFQLLISFYAKYGVSDFVATRGIVFHTFYYMCKYVLSFKTFLTVANFWECPGVMTPHSEYLWEVIARNGLFPIHFNYF